MLDGLVGADELEVEAVEVLAEEEELAVGARQRRLAAAFARAALPRRLLVAAALEQIQGVGLEFALDVVEAGQALLDLLVVLAAFGHRRQIFKRAMVGSRRAEI